MKQLRTRLVLGFLAAILVPLSIALWVTSSLLEHSLALSSTREVETLSEALRTMGREYYQQARQNLRLEAAAGRIAPRFYPLAERSSWPPMVAEFWDGRDKDRIVLAGTEGNRLDLAVRQPGGVQVYSKTLGAVQMGKLTESIATAKDRVDRVRSRDLRRGFLYALLVVGVGGGLATAVLLIGFANRISKPVHELTTALGRFAAGDFRTRVGTRREDEIGVALQAFNHMAEQLEQSHERLILLTRLSSWQALGRKMAHEVKNSLTPIRLTVEEMAARCPQGADRAFFEQASSILVEEVTRLEKRVRAFSDLAAEPPVRITPLDVNRIVEERAGFLRSAHPEAIYNLRLSPMQPTASGDEDLVRGVLTNLLENAAEAAGPGGVVLAVTAVRGAKVLVEVHDSGPGLSAHARETLFEPTISFKKAGMGLGLSIARKSALLSGGDIEVVSGELGGAAFRVSLPLVEHPLPDSTAKEAAWAQSES